MNRLLLALAALALVGACSSPTAPEAERSDSYAVAHDRVAEASFSGYSVSSGRSDSTSTP